MNALVDSGVLGHLDARLQRSEAQLVQNPHHSLRIRGSRIEREEKFGKDWTFRCSEYCFTTQSTHNYLMRWQLTHGSPLLQKYGTLIGHCGKGAMLRRRSFDDDGETEDGKG
jgi:hypothetical protein